MDTPDAMRETLEFLWNNHHVMNQHFDLELMPQERLEVLCRERALTRPFRVSLWLARQGFFLSAWSLWEFYCHGLCERLPHPLKKAHHESCVGWARRVLAAHGQGFPDYDWFEGANSLRNLLAHNCGRAVGTKGKKWLAEARKSFPDLELFRDNYVFLDHPHSAELHLKIQDFIDATASIK